MRVILIRHGIAVPHGAAGVTEYERPLTPLGRRRFREAAKGLTRLIRRPDALFTSPLTRARQTAEIAAKVWGKIEPQETGALAGGSWSELAALLDTQPRGALVALVGHEPQLSFTLARMVGSTDGDRVPFRKGGAALVELPGGLEESGALRWFLTPRILRALV
jgi:phosphohistidine phosphatase